jgi:hypothetical protein
MAACRRLRQEDHDQASTGYTARNCLKKNEREKEK